MPFQSLTAFVLSFFLQASAAAPVDPSANSTQPSQFIGYFSEPNVRGTTSLVLSCLLTLVLCVWSALHLNVPQKDEGWLQCLLCNIRWIITGVYAPELVVFTAWRQWASARLLGKLVTKLSGELRHSPATASQHESAPARQQSTVSLTQRTLYHASTFAERKNKWTKTHDFFASTGGFAFEITSDRQPKFLPESCPGRLTLTARGVALLARCNRLPDVPEKDVLDKSKANDLAKALVVIQASWMLLQTLGRLIAHLPVTLLEVNTIAHVACVFVMYILWWNKPLLPNEPFILAGDWVEPLCAFMYMSSDLSGEVKKKESQTIIKTLFASLDWYSKIPEVDLVSLLVPKPPNEEITENGKTAKPENLTMAFQHTSIATKCLSVLRAKQIEKVADTAFFERRPKVKGVDLKDTVTAPATRRRWGLAVKAIKDYPTLLEGQVLFRHEEDACVHFKSEELLVRWVQNWPSNDLLRNVGGLMVGMVLWMASFAYGAIHASAWNDHFPSIAEKWLWRASATYIGFCGGLWIILNYAAQAYRPLNEFWERWMDGKGSWYWNIGIGSLVFLCGLSFCLARLYIVVEAVVSIRNLPIAAYDTPNWTEIFPHL